VDTKGNQPKVSGKQGDEETDIALVRAALAPVMDASYVSLVRDGLGGTIYFAHCSQVVAIVDADARAAVHRLLQAKLMHAGQEFSFPFLLKAIEMETGKKLQLEYHPADGFTTTTNLIYKFVGDEFIVAPVRRGRGQPSQWNKVELEQAVRKALDLLPDRNRRTLQTVSNLLKEAYPKKAPPTASALKQLMLRLGVDWKALKKEQ
jgi:hypothetical protein